jgi:hypothetical protein
MLLVLLLLLSALLLHAVVCWELHQQHQPPRFCSVSDAVAK